MFEGCVLGNRLVSSTTNTNTNTNANASTNTNTSPELRSDLLTH